MNSDVQQYSLLNHVAGNNIVCFSVRHDIYLPTILVMKYSRNVYGSNTNKRIGHMKILLFLRLKFLIMQIYCVLYKRGNYS